MSTSACPSCGYGNDQASLVCNLCGAVLGTKLPKATATPEAPRARVTTRLDQTIARARTQRLDPAGDSSDRKTQGLRRLEEARTRVTGKLKALSDVQEQAVPVLQAQIAAEREERELDGQLERAQIQLAHEEEELRGAEARLRQLRKRLAALQFELRRVVDERLRDTGEDTLLHAQLERLELIRAELDGDEIPAPRQDAGEEVLGLQAVCRGLSDLVCVLQRRLADRDTWLHWLLHASDSEVARRAAEFAAEADRELGEPSGEDQEEALRWLRAGATDAPG